MTPEMALEIQRETFNGFDHTVGQWCYEQRRRDYDAAEHAFLPDIKTEKERIANATCYLVTSDMCKLTEQVVKTMPDEALLASDLPSRAGFVVLNNPQTQQHIDENDDAIETPIHIYLWTGINVIVDGGDRQNVLFTSYTTVGVNFKNPVVIPPSSPRFVLCGSFMLELGYKINDAFAHVPTTDKLSQENTRAELLFMRALWVLMRQRLTTTTAHTAPRQMRRRFEREDHNNLWADRQIKVITLRRIEYQSKDDSETQMIDWSHRWVVEGHWRNQWYPSLEQHRLKWIAAYIKGPDDKPLKIKDTVAHLAR